MEINLTAEQEAFLRAHYDTLDVAAVVQEHLNRWIDDMAEAVCPTLPDERIKVQRLVAATDIRIAQKENPDLRDRNRGIL